MLTSCFERIINDINDVQEFVPGREWKSRKSTPESFKYNLDPATIIDSILTDDKTDIDEFSDDEEIWEDYSRYTKLRLSQQENAELFSVNKSKTSLNSENDDKYYSESDDFRKNILFYEKKEYNSFRDEKFDSRNNFKYCNDGFYSNYKYKYVRERNAETENANLFKIAAVNDATLKVDKAPMTLFNNVNRYDAAANNNYTNPQYSYVDNATISCSEIIPRNINLNLCENRTSFIEKDFSPYVPRHNPLHTVPNGLSPRLPDNQFRMESWRNVNYADVSVIKETRIIEFSHNGQTSFVVTSNSPVQVNNFANDRFEDVRSLLPVTRSRAPSISGFSNASTSSTHKGLYCPFCRKNGESFEVYTSHALHNPRRDVTCPVLLKHRCEHCGATGKNAHTITYCPLLSRSTDGKRPPSTSVIVKSSLRKSNGQLRDAKLLRQMRM